MGVNANYPITVFFVAAKTMMGSFRRVTSQAHTRHFMLSEAKGNVEEIIALFLLRAVIRILLSLPAAGILSI